MKTLFLVLVLVASLGQANAASVPHAKTSEEIQIELTLKDSSEEVKQAYASCIAENPELNCVNEELGDIWN